MNYLEDYIGVANEFNTDSQFQTLLNNLQQVDLSVNASKIEAPKSIIACLGIQIDAKEEKISIPDKKLKEIKQICRYWRGKKFASKKQFQKLLGNLPYMPKCIKCINLPYLKVSCMTLEFTTVQRPFT